MNEKIKCISRYWLYPSKSFGYSTDECYIVGSAGVSEINSNDSGCYNVEFITGEVISVTDVQYVEYFPNV